MLGKLAGATIVLVLLALVAILSLQSRELRERFRAADDKVKYPYVGMHVPELTFSSSLGLPVTLGKSARRDQLLFVFNTHCPYCKASIPAAGSIWQTLANSPNVELVAVSHDGAMETARYLHDFGLNIPFVSINDERSLGLFHATAVPLLVMIGARGTVDFVHVGELNMDVVESVVAMADKPES